MRIESNGSVTTCEPASLGLACCWKCMQNENGAAAMGGLSVEVIVVEDPAACKPCWFPCALLAFTVGSLDE